jgi:hypothetical protein
MPPQTQFHAQEQKSKLPMPMKVALPLVSSVHAKGAVRLATCPTPVSALPSMPKDLSSDQEYRRIVVDLEQQPEQQVER